LLAARDSPGAAIDANKDPMLREPSEPADPFRSPYPVDPMPREIAALRERAEPLWLFGYGSLMWDPGFAYAEAEPALLRGYCRRFCLYSYDYRGAPGRPGLVLGLDRGGACRGIAYRLAADSLAQSLDRVWTREMAGGVYQMRRLPLRLARGVVSGYSFAVRRQHRDYAGRLGLDETARLVLTGEGSRGRCRDYLESTLAHLEALGLADAPLRRLAARVRALAEEAGD
jgi:glutathione-specific gamma-glutamylcyclotransferase